MKSRSKLSPHSKNLRKLVRMGILKAKKIKGIIYYSVPNAQLTLVISLVCHLQYKENGRGPGYSDFTEIANQFLSKHYKAFFYEEKPLK